MPAPALEIDVAAPQEAAGRWPGPRLVLVLAGLMVLAYWRAPLTFFAIDDFVYLQQTWTPWARAGDFFLYPRGLPEALFALHRRLFDTQHVYYHLVPLALHLANALMVHRLVRWAARGVPSAAPIASILFVLHPAAYTPVTWLSQGFETVPCLTFTLCSALLFVWHLDRGRWWAVPPSVACMALAIASKNNGVLVPVYLAALATIAVSHATTATERTRVAARAAVSLCPYLVFDAWFVLVVLGHALHLQSPAYRMDFAPGALWTSYVKLLSHTFNFLPVAREPIGGQSAVPASFSAGSTAVQVYHWVVGASALPSRGGRSSAGTPSSWPRWRRS